MLNKIQLLNQINQIMEIMIILMKFEGFFICATNIVNKKEGI